MIPPINKDIVAPIVTATAMAEAVPPPPETKPKPKPKPKGKGKAMAGTSKDASSKEAVSGKAGKKGNGVMPNQMLSTRSVSRLCVV